METTSPLFDFGKKLAKKAGEYALDIAKRELDPDRMLGYSMAGFIELAASRYAVDAGDTWKPGQPLKLLFAGYSGTRNTGADVRVEEMVRQVRHLFGDDNVDLSILTIDPKLSQGYFRTVKQLHLPQFFPPFLYEAVHKQHGVIACEGSMFKSKFANALSIMMTGSLGLASAENKLSIAYGGEAGKMDEGLESLVRKYCRDAFVITRNTESGDVLRKLGIPSRTGTDTAWTFNPAPPSHGEELLRAAGWDGKQPILALCPINPFWWPVKPDLMKGAMHAVAGMHGDAHYDSFYFHNDGEKVREKQRNYIAALAEGTKRFLEKHDAFVILVGMEQLDRRACEALQKELGFDAPLFVSDEHDMYSMVSVIRRASMMLSSRYHAIVTSMPGLVPSAGVTMDERIRNLMADRNQPELALEVDDPKLAENVFATLEKLHRESSEIRAGIATCVVTNLERMGQMGQMLVEYVRAKHPEFKVDPALGEHGDPWAHLPELPESLAALVREIKMEKSA